MSNLTDYLKSQTQKITFMEGREKRDLKELLNQEITITDFAFLNGADGKYAVFTIKEDDNSFYFSSSVLTSRFIDIEHEGLKEEVQRDGLKIILKEKKSKDTGRTYIAVEFVL